MCCNLERTKKDVVCFLLGNSPASEIYMPTFRNTLYHLHRQVGACRMNSAEGNIGLLYGKRFGLEMVRAYLPIKMEQTGCSETSAYKIQTPGITQKKAYNIQDTAKV